MRKVTITGAGISAAFEAWFYTKQAKKRGEQIRITMNEKNSHVSETTTAAIFPSLTPDEMLSVVPFGSAFLKALEIPFNEPGGIRTHDVAGIYDSKISQAFIEQAELYSRDEAAHKARVQTLLKLGKASMELWQKFYDDADEELKAILVASNFNSCSEPKNGRERTLHQGYRIDLIYDVNNAEAKAQGMRDEYTRLGYSFCDLLLPSEVIALDPFLQDFCIAQSEVDNENSLKWKKSAMALWRPGGCIDTSTFLPLFYDYLRKINGTYFTAKGEEKDCFQLKFNREVKQVDFREDHRIQRIGFFKNHDLSYTSAEDVSYSSDEEEYAEQDFVFCPGEHVSTLADLGFNIPSYAGFAGASLMLRIPVPMELTEQYKNFNHCMEVHKEGIVLAWQGRFVNGEIIIGVAGTKAFYGDKKPEPEDVFIRDRNLIQLQMINDVLPTFLSMALGRDTKNKTVTAHDLNAARGLGGVRAVAYDGYPTLGHAYHDGNAVSNGFVTTHLGSGGVSNATGAVAVTHQALDDFDGLDEVLQYASSIRK